MAGSLDGCPPDVQRVSQPMPEAGQGRRSPIVLTQEDGRNCPWASTSCPESLRSTRPAVWKRTLVVPRQIGRRENLQLLRKWQARLTLGALPTTRMGAHMRESGLTPAPVALDAMRQQFTVRLETSGGTWPPHIWHTDMQSYHQGACARPGSRDHALA